MEMTTKKYSAKDILSNKTNMTAWLFGNVLHEVLKEQYKDVTLTPSVMESDFIKAVYKGKSWKKDYGQHLRMSIKSPVFIIDVNALTEKTIDLFSIVVKDEFKKQGIGSKLLATMVSLADNLGNDISLVPVAINSTNNVKKAEKAAQWLRDWYSSYEFSKDKDSPEMIYHANF